MSAEMLFVRRTDEHTLSACKVNYERSTKLSYSRIYRPVEKKVEGTC
jgi:hypothetical protein